MAFPIIYLLVLFTAAASATIWWKSLVNRALFPFVPVLWIVFLQELTLHILVLRNPMLSTGGVYNIYGLLNMIFFAAIYFRLPFHRPYRRLIIGLVVTYVAAFALTFALSQSVMVYNKYLFISAGFIIDCLGLLFLFNYFSLDDAAEEEKWRPLLWITIGIVIHYPVVNISLSLYNHLLENKATFFGVRLYRVIPQTMSVFMYTCFIYAFYLCKKKN